MKIRSYILSCASSVVLAAALFAAPASAAITISTDATQNLVCSSGVCAPTATDAVLNVNDLENYLAAGNLEVTTSGSGVEASDIDIEAALTWSNSSALSLVANQAIQIDQSVSIAGSGGLLLTNDGDVEALTFGRVGSVTFSSLSSSLSINNQEYTLANSVKGLATAIANNPTGDFALAANFDAKGDGVYTVSPVHAQFGGVFEGLGNKISHLTIDSNIDAGQVGLIDVLGAGAVVRDFGLSDLSLQAKSAWVGGLTGYSYGTVVGCHVTGSVREIPVDGIVGGLIGINNDGTIANSYSNASVSGGAKASVGGLVGMNLSFGGATGTISGSFATGPVKATRTSSKAGTRVGGLAGLNQGSISNSYATGRASTGSGKYSYYSAAGGLVGYNISTITDSYSTGKVHTIGYDGGFIGKDVSTEGNLADDYWDTQTSGVSNPSQGAGNISNDPGITGLTSAQLQSGLPSGFDPSIWAESSSINNGFPYLTANPPPK